MPFLSYDLKKKLEVKLVKKSSKARATAPGSYRDLENQLSRAITSKYRSNSMNKADVGSYPVDIIPDSPVTSGKVVIEDYSANTYYEVPFSTDEDGNYTLGDEVEVQQTLTYESVKSSVLAVEKAKDHVMFTGTVLIPGEPDCDFENGEEPLTEEQVAKMAHEFITNYRIVDKNHDYFQTGKEVGQPVESWLLEEPQVLKNIKGEEREYPKGTWIVKSKITDPETMKLAEKGQVAYSVTALSKNIAEQLKAAGKSRTLIKDLEDPVGYTVSLVKNPCVDNSCSAKAAIKAGRALSKDNKSSLTKARDIINNLLNLDSKNDIKPKGDETVTDEGSKKDGLTVEDVTKAVQKAVEPFDTRLKELEGKSEKADTQKCPKCKATCPSDAKFCPSCGAKLTNSGAGKSDEENNDDGTQQAGTKSLTNNDTGGKPQPAVKSVYEETGRDALGIKIMKN